MKTLILFFVIALSHSLSSHAVDICSGVYDGSFRSHTTAEYNRVGKVERLEKFINGARRLKANPQIIEIERVHIERFQALDPQLYDGDIALILEKWKPFFRKFERSYHEVEKLKVILPSLSRQVGAPVDALNDLLKVYKNDPFMIDILTKLRGKNYSDLEVLIKSVSKNINKSGRYLGRQSSKYKIYRQHLDFVQNSKYCDDHCKKAITKLKSKLGAGASDELHRFPMLKGLKTPSIAQVQKQIDMIPKAYEMSLIAKALHEVKAAFRDLATFPRGREAIAKFLIKVLPKNKTVIRTVDDLLMEVESVANHYPLINKIVRKKDDVLSKLDRLRGENVRFSQDELLVTFSRRVDQRAMDTWSSLRDVAKKSDPKFYNRMKKAEELAVIKGDLSPNYKRSPIRAFAVIAGSLVTSGGMMLLFDTPKDEEEVTGEGNLEVIELEVSEQEQSGLETEITEIKLYEESAIDFLTDYSSDFLESIEQVNSIKK